MTSATTTASTPAPHRHRGRAGDAGHRDHAGHREILNSRHIPHRMHMVASTHGVSPSILSTSDKIKLQTARYA
jgi:hypothetical protein